MRYTSTRDAKLSFTASHCFVKGISADGGLFVPEEFPVISAAEIAAMADQPYSERAFAVLSRYLTDFSAEELRECIDGAYGTKFDENGVCPLHATSENTSFMELFHGPTLAFKDVALQILPRFLRVAKAHENEPDEIRILVATSGDTGKAALEGFADVPGMSIAVFFPNDGVSRMQQLQMTTQEGNNVFVCAVNGNFDDAQTGVKTIFADVSFNAKLKEKGVKLSSANSINWGRLVPQIVYYFSAYADLLKAGTIAMGEKINFVVPTGNFGDILAGWYAKQMGLPVGKLICASNKNNVLTDFFATGVYDANRTFYKTASPSMDILVSSNLERLLFEVSGRNDSQVRTWMTALKTGGRYELAPELARQLRETFCAYWADEDETAAAIREQWQKNGYCIDTHTGVGAACEKKFRAAGGEGVTVVLSTASPYKFPKAVLTAINGSAPEDDFEAADALKAMGVAMPGAISALKTKEVLHKTVCDKTDMEKVLWEKNA